ncbi:MULE transposase domain [Phytophthora cactorum]|nr:MULE transposase domain [Phytophthora cactorum]
MVLTPQQTRNILQQILGSTTLERTKTILDAFADGDVGNDVLFVQDQMDITCVIAIQTSIQKKYFFQWGDTLVMDWTHGTNNLGYHLALDQKAVTMENIVEFFKRKNRAWKSIQTIVIDKDFVEWRVLDKAFPDAKVLLCQFHALTYWRKVCKHDKFNMKVTERDTMESAFAKLIYW